MNIKIKNTTLLYCIISIQVVIILYYCNRKSGFFIDELWTYNLSNSFYFPLLHNIGDLLNKWLPQSFWIESLTASPDHTFEYGSVIYNQTKDVHPPLYYFVIHTICSFFPGVLSKWHGIMPNVIFFIITQILIYKIASFFFKDSHYTLLPCIIYGFCVGCINSVLFIRMYSMLTLISIYCMYINLNIIYKEKQTYKDMLFIFISYLIGILTHYYFIIFSFFMSFFVLLIFIIKKNIRHAIIYSIAPIMSVLCSLLVWPSLISHIFYDYRGEEAFKNAATSSIIDRFFSFINICDNDVYIKYYIFVFFTILSYFILSKFIKIKKNNQAVSLQFKIESFNIELYINNNFLAITYILCSTFFTFLLISKVAAFTNSRYIMYLYPSINIIISIFLIKICKLITDKFAICLLIVSISIIPNLQTKNIEYLYKIDKPLNKLLLESTPRRDFVAITGYDNWWPSVQMTKFFINSEKTYITAENNLTIPKISNGTILYIARTCKNKNLINKIMSETGMHRYKKIYTEWHGDIYELLK